MNKPFDETGEMRFPDLEAWVLQFWREQRIFQKSDQKTASKGEFVFFEGPPTANGQPAMHHVLARSFKDLFPRYKAMQGFHVTRKGGWDTHGLPVEIAVEKKLGVLGRKALSRDEIAEFNQTCKSWVFENLKDWNHFTERMGFWLDLDNAYVTYTNEYIESVWNLLKRLWDKGLVVQDYKVVPLSPRISTTLSANEIAEGYREVDDPSVYVRFPLKLDTTPLAVQQSLAAQGVTLNDLDHLAILVWTTTPWTLPSNTMAAVNPHLEYAVVRSASVGCLILAADAVERLKELHQEELPVLARLKGHDLAWWEYTPPFPEVCIELGVVAQQGQKRADGQPLMHFVALADFVSADDGSGVAHEAPVYGAEDLELSRQYGVPLLFGTNEYGVMQVTDERGKFFKEADKGLIRIMKERGVMYHAGQIRHRYPFHDRTGDPILYFAKPSWYIKTSRYRQQLFGNNEQINWVPPHIKHGRFGNWLKDNVDWAISRERYWGTPLPFWVSEDGKDRVCVGSLQELSQLVGRDLSGLDLHRPHVDDITFVKNGQTYKRVPEVLDVWFDSGAMPYAQWHLLLDEQGQPLQGSEANFQTFERHFNADYICEAIDQTRGWFYSLHAISTLLYNRPAFKNVICLGHLVDEKGHKMSKSKGNVIEPLPMFDKYGADPVRWYMFTASEPGDQKRFSERLVSEAARGFLGTLWNVYSFFVMYANLDRPNLQNPPPLLQRPEMDRWLVSRTQELIEQVTQSLESYDARGGARALEAFVEELSNWYVRRSRRRFWKNEDPTDRESAYATLYEALVTLITLAAPYVPFVSEALWQNLVRSQNPAAPESVHLAAWPQSNPQHQDQGLLRSVHAVLEVVGLARAARAKSGVKTRIPLPLMLVTAPAADERQGLQHFAEEMADELNVKELRVLGADEPLLSYRIKPNLPLLGKKYGKQLPAIRQALESLDGKSVAQKVKNGQPIELPGLEVALSGEEVLLEALSPEGYEALENQGYVAALEVRVDEGLYLEGLARELVRLVQQARKEMGLHVADRIHLSYTASGKYAQALQRFGLRLQEETLALGLQEGNPQGFATELQDDEEGFVRFGLQKA